MLKSIIWRITTGSFLATSKYRINFFLLGFNFNRRDLVERQELVLVEGKSVGVISCGVL